MVLIVRLVYYTLVDNHVYKYVRHQKYRRYGIWQTIATSAFGQTRRIVDSRIHERLDMSEELLGVISDPADDT